jgi:preprotein translocase subunit SecD
MLRIRIWQVVIVAVISAAAIIFAVPNIFGRASLESYPSWLPSSQVNLGLDLQGGSHLLLEVQVADIVRERMATLVDDTRVALRRAGVKYTGLKGERDRVVFSLVNPEQIGAAQEAVDEIDPEAEIDNDAGGAFEIVLTSEAMEERQSAAVNQSIEIIRRRIDETGVREPTIQRQGDDRILVQLPGVDDPERVKRLLGKTAKLSFHLLDENVTALDRERGRTPRGALRLPSDDLDDNGNEISYVIRKRVMVSGDSLVDAATTRDQRGQWAVSFRFDSSGARKFGEVTTENVNRPFAIVLDGRVISAPVIREPIVGGTGQITGNFTVEEANDLSLLLRAGALPAPMKILEERTVGPDLGADSIEAGTIACIIGLAAVILFMFLYYGFFGLVANLALILNLIIMLGVLSLLQATLTLPGIAGVVLTIGMAVDANVLIFERIREEARAGRAPFSAMEAGYRRAFTTIIDSNLTTLIAAIILFIIGSGPVKGFAVTLGIGIATSMFTAMLVSRLILVAWLRQRRPSLLPI